MGAPEAWGRFANCLSAGAGARRTLIRSMEGMESWRCPPVLDGLMPSELTRGGAPGTFFSRRELPARRVWIAVPALLHAATLC